MDNSKTALYFSDFPPNIEGAELPNKRADDLFPEGREISGASTINS